MPVSRGRGGRRRPDKNRKRGRPRSARPQSMFPASIPETVGDAELASVEMIATAMGGLLSHPACPGPLLIHVDGAFECHGTGCPGAMAIFHGDDVLEPCSRHPEIQSTRRARACRGGHDTGWRHPRRRSRTVSTGAANACLADHVAELAQRRKTDRAVERYCVSQPPQLARAGSLSR
jgi:hypothetical protein